MLKIKLDFNFLFHKLISRYCNSHLQVLGLVPKKTRRKKASECQDSVDKESTQSMRDSSQPRADVSTILGHQNMSFISPVVPQHRHKRQKTKIQKKVPDIPAICELKECLKRSKQDREDLFESYGENYKLWIVFHFKNILRKIPVWAPETLEEVLPLFLHFWSSNVC